MKKVISILYLICFTLGSLHSQIETVEVPKTLIAPVLDGIEEGIWNDVMPVLIEKSFMSESPTISAYWKALWSDTCLFVLVHVTDDNFFPSFESGGNTFEYDRVEVYLDVNSNVPSGNGPADTNSGTWQVSPNLAPSEGTENFQEGWDGHMPDHFYAYHLDGESYNMEIRIPFRNLYDQLYDTLGVDDIAGRTIGFDVTVVDQDENITVSRQRMVWQGDGSTTGDESWNTMAEAGKIILAGSSEYGNYNDTILCDSTESAFVSFRLNPDSIQNYEWLTDGIIQSSGKNSCVVKWNESGFKSVKLFYEKISGEYDTLERKVIIYPKLTVSLKSEISECIYPLTTLKPKINYGNMPLKYFWNGSEGDSVYSGVLSGNEVISLLLIDHSGCKASVSYESEYIPGKSIPDICMVTNDPATKKNKVIWYNSDKAGVKEYKIMKESTISDQYDIIAILSGNINSYIDFESEPAKKANRYYIQSVDSCDFIYSNGAVHQPIHLQISPGLPGNYNLSWSPYYGFNYHTYYIYKGNTKNSMVLYDSVASTLNQYTDGANGIKYYQVAVRREQSCSDLQPNLSTGSRLKTTDFSSYESRSNIISTEVSEISSSEFTDGLHVFPNPFSDEFAIELYSEVPQTIHISIYNLLGKKIYEYKQFSESFTEFRHIIQAEELKPVSGMYILNVEVNGKSLYYKLSTN